MVIGISLHRLQKVAVKIDDINWCLHVGVMYFQMKSQTHFHEGFHNLSTRQSDQTLRQHSAGVLHAGTFLRDFTSNNLLYVR